MTTKCMEISESLSAFLDGEERPEESAAVRAHLEDCADCRTTAQDWATIDLAVAGTVAERAPVRPLRRATRRRYPVLLAASLAIALTAGTAVFAGLGSSPARDKAADARERAIQKRSATSSIRPAAAGAAVVVTEATGEPKPSETPPAKPDPVTSEPSDKNDPGRGFASDRELALMVMVERTYVRSGEPVTVALGLGNVTDHAVTFWTHKESPFDVVLRDRQGNEAYRRSVAEGWANEPAERTMHPKEFLKETATVTAPAPGYYVLYVECLCVRGFAPPATAEGEQTPRPTGGDEPAKDRPYGRLETSPIKLFVAPQS